MNYRCYSAGWGGYHLIGQSLAPAWKASNILPRKSWCVWISQARAEYLISFVPSLLILSACLLFKEKQYNNVGLLNMGHVLSATAAEAVVVDEGVVTMCWFCHPKIHSWSSRWPQLLLLELLRCCSSCMQEDFLSLYIIKSLRRTTTHWENTVVVHIFRAHIVLLLHHASTTTTLKEYWQSFRVT